MVRRSREEAELTREMIVRESERLFVTRGYAAVTLADIADAAGVTRGAVYGHFKGKDAVLAEVLARAQAGLLATLHSVRGATDSNSALRGLQQLCGSLFGANDISSDRRAGRKRSISPYRLFLELPVKGEQANVIHREINVTFESLLEKILSSKRGSKARVDPATGALLLQALLLGLGYIDSKRIEAMSAGANPSRVVFIGLDVVLEGRCHESSS
jgi:AcrR family transcriptional regulator